MMENNQLIKDVFSTRGIPLYIYTTPEGHIAIKFSLYTKKRDNITRISKKRFKNIEYTFFYNKGIVITIRGPKKRNKIAVGFFLRKVYNFYLTLQDLI